jgi:hypothetical protein
MFTRTGARPTPAGVREPEKPHGRATLRPVQRVWEAAVGAEARVSQLPYQPDIVTALQAARWEAFHTGRYSRAADPARSGGCCWEIWKSAAAQCSGDITGIVSNDLGVQGHPDRGPQARPVFDSHDCGDWSKK